MRAVRRMWRRLELGWRAGLRRLAFFTQRTAVLLAGVLAASLAMLGGVVALVGWPGSRTADHHHHDHAPARPPRPGRLHPAALIHRGTPDPGVGC